MSDGYEQVLAERRAQWHAWLQAHHRTSPGIWLVTWKKASGRPQLSYDAIVDEALCYGWVDSRPRSIDGQQSARLITPRKPASNWSARNKARVGQLTAAGLMHPAGLAAVAAAKANGTWTTLDHVETLTEPPDLTTALDATPSARHHWDAFPRSTRRAILEWITNAKTSTTRQAASGAPPTTPPATSAPTNGSNLRARASGPNEEVSAASSHLIAAPVQRHRRSHSRDWAAPTPCDAWTARPTSSPPSAITPATAAHAQPLLQTLCPFDLSHF